MSNLDSPSLKKMMKQRRTLHVFVMCRGYSYEGESLYAVFTSRAKAYKHIEDLVAKPDNRYPRLGCDDMYLYKVKADDPGEPIVVATWHGRTGELRNETK